MTDHWAGGGQSGTVHPVMWHEECVRAIRGRSRVRTNTQRKRRRTQTSVARIDGIASDHCSVSETASPGVGLREAFCLLRKFLGVTRQPTLPLNSAAPAPSPLPRALPRNARSSGGTAQGLLGGRPGQLWALVQESYVRIYEEKDRDGVGESGGTTSVICARSR